ncbi:rubrerythrin [Lichenihabitans sp. PAMC28606]|uniref:iron exporter MbfA n=1 Tax=Lichenihabitans sp. PAMC28606 TaxID=2880932 RepID=UPI001D0B3DA1|nr:ferritin family protein [Lichenihabitans sp. PAMC28606]UDL93560.1 rubrerythrin [Lichenihabitans sp. PAMC28606]
MKSMSDLDERELLALAISSEEEDGRVYLDFAESLREQYPDSAKVFADMAAEENHHRRSLIDMFARRFGDHIPLIRRQDIRGWVQRRPHWQVRAHGIGAVRAEVRRMEQESGRFYLLAASRTTDTAVRKLLGDLAEAEQRHDLTAASIEAKHLPDGAKGKEEDDASKRFVLQIIQPGLVGLMDGSVSTLAPVFAAAFATHNSWNAFQVGMAASLGAGISMGFAEALADDGKISGRGTPYLRGLVCGLMTIAGGIGHTLPYLIKDFYTATAVAAVVVMIELLIIAWIQWRYMDTPPISAAAKVMLGGGLVLATGILIGSS